jgi:hypothetical protein
MRPSPSHSLRSVLVLLALGALAMAATAYLSRSAAAPTPASDPPVSLDEAVERTLAAGTARLDAELTTKGVTMELAGVISLTTDDGDLTFTVPDEVGLGPIGVRTVGGSTWVRVDDRWLDAGHLPTFGDLAAGWGDYVAGLEADGPASGEPRRATLRGTPAQVWLDDEGHVARLVVSLSGNRFDLRFSDFGVALDLEAPEDPEAS